PGILANDDLGFQRHHHVQGSYRDAGVRRIPVLAYVEKYIGRLNMMNVWILFGALLLSGLVLLLLDAFRFKENLKASRKFDRVLKTQSRKPDNYGRWLSAIKVRMFRVSSESGTLLVQAGWDSKLNFLVWIFF